MYYPQNGVFEESVCMEEAPSQAPTTDDVLKQLGKTEWIVRYKR